MSRVIKNYNIATNGNFKLEIPDAPGINFFAQMCNLPSLTMSGIETINLHRQAVMPR